MGTASDADGDAPTMSYAWSKGSAGATLTLTEANNPGDTVTCTATATDDAAGTATGSASATVSNTPPSLGAVTLSPATAYNDDVPTCSATATDADGGAPRFDLCVDQHIHWCVTRPAFPGKTDPPREPATPRDAGDAVAHRACGFVSPPASLDTPNVPA